MLSRGLLPIMLAWGLTSLCACSPVEPAPEPSALGASRPAALASCEPVFLLQDILPGPASGSNPSYFTPFNGALFFIAYEPTHGYELWKTDGTPAGTSLVKDINPGSLSSDPASLTVVNGVLFFVATEASTGRELWKTDGTGTGTVRVLELRPGPDNGNRNITNLVDVGGTLFFTTWDNGSPGIRELWKSDGTGAGTVLVKQLATTSNPPNGPTQLTAMGGTLYFENAMDPVTGTEVWKSDGTEAGTVLLEDIAPGPSAWERPFLTPVGSTLFFTANDGTTGFELWKTDGTGTGTVRVKDLYPGAASGFPSRVVEAGGTIFFAASDAEAGSELWKTDGTGTGTVRVRDLRPGPEGSAPSFLTAAGGTLFFVARSGGGSDELWKTDGTGAGTVRVMTFGRGGAAALRAVGGVLFFSADDGVTGRELWRSDGTAVGTYLVQDLNPGAADASPSGLMPVGGRLVFVATHPDSGTELWATRACAPALTCPSDVVAEAVDSTGATLSLPPPIARGDPLSSDTPALVYSPSSGGLFPVGDTTVTVTGTWPSGEVAACTFRVTVRDTVAPTIRCPPDAVFEATGPFGTPINYPPATAADAVSTPVISYDPPQGSSLPLGTSRVTARATDTAGNSSTCTFLVTLQDTTPPALRCPADVVAQGMNDSGGVVDYPPAEAADAVSRTNVVYEPPSGSFFPMGTTRVRVEATDTWGNVAVCSFQVTVTPPSKRFLCGVSSPDAAAWLLLLLAPLVVRPGQRRKRPHGSRPGAGHDSA